MAPSQISPAKLEHAGLRDGEIDRDLPARGGEPPLGAGKIDFLAREQLAKQLYALPKFGDSVWLLADGMDGDPTRAEAQQGASIGKLVECGRGVGGHRRMTRPKVGDRTTDLDRTGRHRRNVHRRIDVLHSELMIDEPQCFEAEFLGLPRDLPDLAERLSRADSPRNSEPLHHQALLSSALRMACA